MDNKKIRILYIETIEINMIDILFALDEIGYEVFRADTNISMQGYKKESCQTIMDMVKEYQIQYVITYDFSESIAQACFETEVPYISWVYDAPQIELYTHYAFYPSNYIFVFDKKQKERLRQIGIKNVYYMPLAIMPNKMNITANENQENGAEIAFVGRLWKNDANEKLLKSGKENILKSIEKNMEECFLCWNKTISLHGKMEEEIAEYFDLENKGVNGIKYPFASKQFYYEVAITSRMLASRERITILNTLAQKHDVRFYTDSEQTEELSEKVKIMPPVFSHNVYKIYANSKINLNITLHCIETGVPQRVFEVMAAGGFMLSNYQEELEELFVPGEDIVLYHNLEELEELVDYYLTHEEERARIAKNGQRKVLEYHDMHDRLEIMLDFVSKKESAREKTYSVLQKEAFYEQIEKLLEEGTEHSYEELYHLFDGLQYAKDVPREKDFLWLIRMLNCWKLERDEGTFNMFLGITNLEEAEQKYLRIQQGVWNVENELSEEKCREAICRICENKDSMLLAAWIIKTDVQKPERVFLAMSEYILDYNIMDAIRLLDYGFRYFPQSKELAQKYIEYFHALKEIMEEM